MPTTTVVGIFTYGYMSGSSRDQSVLFPVSLDELIPDEHPCRIIEALVNWLDLSAQGFAKARPRATGRHPGAKRDPAMCRSTGP